MSLVILLWPAIGALALRERFIMAAALAVLVAVATLAGFSQIALAALMAAALTYVAAMSDPLRVARIMAIGLRFFFSARRSSPLCSIPSWFCAHLPIAGSIGVFSDLVVHEWPRFITGHGLEMVERGIDSRPAAAEYAAQHYLHALV